MGIFVLGMLVGWVLTSVLIGFAGAFLAGRIAIFKSFRFSSRLAVIALLVCATPFLYWNLRIATIGALWAAECEETTRYVLHRPPPLDYVSVGGVSWNSENWERLATTQIRSLVVEDRPNMGLLRQQGTYVLDLAEPGDPDCRAFDEYMSARPNWNLDFLQGQCVRIKPADPNHPITKVSRVPGSQEVLRENGDLAIIRHQYLLQNEDTKEVYAEFVEAYFKRPNVTQNLFVLFGFSPSCKKLELLKANNLYTDPFRYAYSREFRARVAQLIGQEE